ncbi:MAG: hypothetical protein OHK0013_27680 [Sandaracinaceae bacterium]
MCFECANHMNKDALETNNDAPASAVPNTKRVGAKSRFSLVYFDVRDPSAVRRGTWPFPELEATVDRTMPLPWPSRTIPQTSSAWSPTTGTIAFTTGVYYTNQNVAVQCPEADGGRFIVSFAAAPRDWTYTRTHLVYRENGELLVHLGALYVLGPRGELLRSTGLPPDSVPLAYTPECGLLYGRGRGLGGNLTWWDVDSIQPRETYLTPVDGLALRILPDCRPLVARDGQWWVGMSSVSVVPAEPAGADILPLRDGGVAAVFWDSAEIALLDSTGAEIGRVPLDTFVEGYSYYTPEGDLGTLGGGFWEVGLQLAPWGTLETGLNWAHTNSPLPP